MSERVVALTRTDPPGETTHWTGAMMAAAVGISVSSVQRIWRAHGLQPHRVRQFKLSNDPQFVAKLRDVSGSMSIRRHMPSYHRPVGRREEPNPGARPHATGIAAEEGACRHHDARLQAQRHHDTVRGAECARRDGDRPQHAAPRHQEFIRFLNAIEAQIPAGKLIEVVLDNYAAHKHPKVMAWLGRHPRFTFHFTPTSCFLAQCRRGLLRQAHQAPAEARRVPIRRRAAGGHQPLSRRAQRRAKALHLDRRPRQNHRRRQARGRGHQVLDSIH
jgi:hypothetical protein